MAIAELFVMVRGETAMLGRDVEKGAAAAGTLAGKAFTTAFVASGILAVGVGVVLEKSIRAAGDFQAAMVRLTTSAGETGTMVAGNLKLVSDGILDLAPKVGTSVTELSRAMYTIESGSFHGAEGLKVLRAAAEGAKAENADLKLVADAVTSSLVDYHLSADQSAMVTTKLVAATAAGKTTFQELTGSLHSVLPAASAAHISLDDILGSLASMTLHGMSADQATQNLTDVIRHMQAPTATQAKELALLGLTTNQLADDLRTKGLSGTLQEINDRIVHMMPPGSERVILDLRTSLASLSPEVKALGMRLIEGTITAREYRNESLLMTPIQRTQAQSFLALAGATHRIGDEQLTGAQVLQTYGGALQKATGDATGMNVSLMLTGENAETTRNAIKAVAGATTEAGNHVAGWGVIQETFNFKLAAFKATAQQTSIELGTGLLPAAGNLLTTIQKIIGPMGAWVSTHQKLTATIAESLAGIGAFALSVLTIAKMLTVIARVVELLRLAAIAQAAWNAVLYITDLLTIKGAASWLIYDISVKAAAISTKLLAAATWLWDAAMDANPIGLVIIAIVALVAAIILAIKYHKEIAAFIVNTWNTVWAWSHDVIMHIRDFIVNTWNTVYEWTANVFSKVKSFIVNTWNAIVDSVLNFLAPAIRVVTVLFETFWSIFKLSAQVSWAIVQIVFALIRIEIAFLGHGFDALKDIVVKAWHVITDAVSSAWHQILVWFNELRDAIAVRLTTTINIFRDLWASIWGAIRNVVSQWWANVLAIFNAVRTYLVVQFGPAFGVLRDVLAAVWARISSIISAAWANIRNIFSAIVSFVTVIIPNAFHSAVDAIGRWWGAFVGIVKNPVKIVIDTVINGGIIRGLNWVTDHLHISNAHIDDFHPPGFAAGGQPSGLFRGKGGPREDKNIIAISDREFIVNAGATERWLPVLEYINSKGHRGSGPSFKYPGDGSTGIRAYADGGIVGTLEGAAKNILNFFTNPVKTLTEPLNRLVDALPSGIALRPMLVGAGHKMVEFASTFLTKKVSEMASIVGGGVDTGAAPQAMNFLRAQVGKPYVWASAGPGGYDCSGIVSAVWNILHGKSPYNHTFSTMNEAPYFPLPGMGPLLSAGWTNPGESGPGGNDVGHTAGVLAGIPFESTGGVGVRMGSGITAIGRFAHVGHFDRGGPWPTGTFGYNGSGRTEHVTTGQTMDSVVDRLDKLIVAVDRIAPGVGAEINGASRALSQAARAR